MKLFFLTAFLFLVSPAYAADFDVHIPDELMLEGEKWEHYTNADPKEKAQLFLDKCVFDPSTRWVLDFVIFTKTHGKIQNFSDSGITVEVKK